MRAGIAPFNLKIANCNTFITKTNLRMVFDLFLIYKFVIQFEIIDFELKL